MAAETFTCPRCFAEVPIRPETRFCPHCGLADAQDAASDTSPLEVTIGKRRYHVQDRIAVGSICNVYRCTFEHESRPVEGTFKIARDARTNDLVLNEADVLRHLHSADSTGEFGPFLPAIHDSIRYGEARPKSAPRHANVLRVHPEIRSPADELYSLVEVRREYVNGLDARDMAWIWRRLLNVLSFAHAQQVIHTAVLPAHVLIEPREHKLLLIDWCCAARDANLNRHALTVISGGYMNWYRREAAMRHPPTLSIDIAFAARCMIDLLGGEPVSGEIPASVEPALHRYFRRCLNGHASDAPRLLAEFDELIVALWGPRQFRPLTMPPKRRP
jgi:hypothetical protein